MVASKHILQQGPVLAVLARTAWAAVRPPAGAQAALPATPADEVRAQVGPLPPALLRDYVRLVGGDPSAYPHRVPHHLFPQWTFPLAARTLAGLPYPLYKIVNAGCRLEFHAPLPAGEPLFATAQLLSLEDEGHRLRIHQRVTTSTAAVPEALVAHIYATVPTKPRGSSEGPRAVATLPVGAQEIARWSLRKDTGWNFAKLTGDFNPLHWSARYARLMGSRNAIAHGFFTLARTIESLQRNCFAGSTRALAAIEVRFRKPLVLPAKVGVYVDGSHVYVGDGPGGPAYLTGTFEARTP